MYTIISLTCNPKINRLVSSHLSGRISQYHYLTCQICHVSTNALFILQLVIDLKWEKALHFIINSFVKLFSITFILVIVLVCFACTGMNTLIDIWGVQNQSHQNYLSSLKVFLLLIFTPCQYLSKTTLCSNTSQCKTL